MAAYIKFDGVDGESRDKGHEKWIDLESVSHGVHRPGTGQTGTARRRGSVMLDDIHCTKLMDSASTDIKKMVLKGKSIPKVEIHLTTSSVDSGRETFHKIILEDVYVCDQTVSASSQGVPMESFSLNFAKIKEEYVKMSDKGTKEATAKYGWDVEKAEEIG